MVNDWDWPGAFGLDIGANTGAGGAMESVWMIDPFDKIPRRWDEPTHQFIVGPSICALRIDVAPQGVPWVVMCDNRIARLEGDSWVEVPGGGLANDIGIGQNGSVWVIGLDNQAASFDGSGWSWQGGPADQRAIDVEPNGTPWVVTWSGEIWVLGQSGWESDSAITSGRAIDIGIGGASSFLDYRSYIWILETDGTIWIKNRQESHPAGCDPNVPDSCQAISRNRCEWVERNDNPYKSVTASGRGRPWVINSALQYVYRRMELPF